MDLIHLQKKEKNDLEKIIGKTKNTEGPKCTVNSKNIPYFVRFSESVSIKSTLLIEVLQELDHQNILYLKKVSFLFYCWIEMVVALNWTY